MILFVCLDCGRLFTEFRQWEETHGLTSGPYESFSGCPYCYGAYTEAHRCDNCDEWITDEYIKIDDKRYCSDCYQVFELGEE